MRLTKAKVIDPRGEKTEDAQKYPIWLMALKERREWKGELREYSTGNALPVKLFD